MRKSAIITAASTALLVLGALTVAPTVSAAEAAKPTDPIALGKIVAEDRSKGNCYACHGYEGASLAGTIAPPLGNWLQQKYKTKEALRAQIWDATKANPNSRMIPYGKHQILTEAEIDAVTEWTWSLK